jgi:uncharacterized damage-inducible protein DinB
MEDKDSIGGVVLTGLQSRIAKVLPTQIRECVERLSEEQLWWRPNEQSNSVGNLVLHVSGSTMHFLCRNIGGFEYERDRPAEFLEHGPMSKQQLLEIFNETIEKAAHTFDSLNTSDLMKPSTEPAYYDFVLEDLLGVATHLATHTGQIVYITKMLEEGSVDGLWIRAHKMHGAWKTS